MTGDGRTYQPHWDLPQALDATFTCERTGCRGMRAGACIQRQRVDEAQANRADPERGQSSSYPNCHRCPQGLAIRELLDSEHEAFRGVGPGGRRERARTLRDVPLLDTPAPPVPTAADGRRSRPDVAVQGRRRSPARRAAPRRRRHRRGDRDPVRRGS